MSGRSESSYDRQASYFSGKYYGLLKLAVDMLCFSMKFELLLLFFKIYILYLKGYILLKNLPLKSSSAVDN